MVVYEPKNDFLKELKRICEKNGTLVIFDEMWTGFRLALGGASEYFQVKPDLACFSKAVANGMPISILTGRKDIMSLFEKEVFFYTTFGGEALSLAAAKKTMEILERDAVIPKLHEKGNSMKASLQKLVNELEMPYVKCLGLGPRTMLTFQNVGAAEKANLLEVKSFVQQDMFRFGILWNSFHNMALAHDPIQDIDYTLKAYADILPRLKKSIENGNVKAELRGESVQPVFRRVTQFHTKPKNKT
jgi:glutamate-1-semialdehyde aminotransferase